MYIGPWQEYNLSKSRGIYQNRIGPTLKSDIEQAILNSLDPDTAKVALAAVNPYLKQNNLSDIPKRPNQYLPTHTQFHGRIIRKRNNNSLPPVTLLQPSNIKGKSDVLSARDRNLNSASPVSTVRSTQSEPIRNSQSTNRNENKLAIADVSKANVLIKNEDNILINKQQPPYNAPAMLSLLRQERNTNARTKIAKLTGWKINNNEDNNILHNENEKKRKLQINNDNKLEQINMMKQLYLSGDNTNTITTTTTASKIIESNNLKLPSILSSKQQPLKQQSNTTSITAAPSINDFDLTDADFSLVSKYFQFNNDKLINSDDTNTISSNNKPISYDIHAASQIVYPKIENNGMNMTHHSDSIKNKIVFFDDDDHSINSRDDTSNLLNTSINLKNNNNDNTICDINNTSIIKGSQPEPIQTIEQHGMEGLLNWSKELEMDML